MILTTIASTLLGLLGTGVTTYSNYQMAKLDLDKLALQSKNKIAEIAAESLAMKAEADASIAISQTISNALVDMNESKAFISSFDLQKTSLLPPCWVDKLYGQQGLARYMTIPLGVLLIMIFAICDVISKLMQPGLTLYSFGLATWVTYKSYEVLEKANIEVLTALQASNNWTEVTTTIYMLAVTFGAWWFGDRRMAKHLRHLKEGKE